MGLTTEERESSRFLGHSYFCVLGSRENMDAGTVRTTIETPLQELEFS